jgi:fluoride exporter
MEKLFQIVAVSLGGVIGVNARYWLGVWINRWTNQQFPWATFVINVSGSFAIGFLTAILTRWLPHPNARLLVITGFLGGYTTYSSFAFESQTLWERGERALSIGYMASTLVAGFLAVVLGVMLAREVVTPRAERATRSDASVPAEVDWDRPAESRD